MHLRHPPASPASMVISNASITRLLRAQELHLPASHLQERTAFDLMSQPPWDLHNRKGVCSSIAGPHSPDASLVKHTVDLRQRCRLVRGAWQCCIDGRRDQLCSSFCSSLQPTTVHLDFTSSTTQSAGDRHVGHPQVREGCAEVRSYPQ